MTTVVLLDALEGVSVQNITQNHVVITFSGTAPSISPGDILTSSQVIGEHFGCLRTVTGVEVQGGTMTLTTADAWLTDAVIECTVDTNLALSMYRMQNFESLEGVRPLGNGLDLSNVVLFSGGVGGANLTLTITSGSVSFQPDLDIGWRIKNREVSDFHAIASGTLFLDLDIQAALTGSMTFSHEKTLASYSSVSVIFIGWLPVVVVNTINFVAGFNVQADAGTYLTKGFDQTNAVQVGAVYDGAWSPVWSFTPSLSGHPVDWTDICNFEIEVFVRPEVSSFLYGVAGPRLSVKPYLAFRGGASNLRETGGGSLHSTLSRTGTLFSWWWNLVGGISGALNFDISVLGKTIAEFTTELFGWETVLAQDGGGFWPMSLGDTWEYLYMGSTFHWTVVEKGLSMPFGENIIRIEQEAHGVTQDKYFQNDQDWVREYYYYDGAMADEYDGDCLTYLSFPLYLGKTWLFIDDDEEPVYATITSMSSTVSVPAGTFHDCVRVYIQGEEPGEYMDYYWHEGVGLIRHDIRYDEITLRQELVSYEISKLLLH